MRNTTLWFLMAGFTIGFACAIVGMILTEKDKRRRKRDMEQGDIEDILRFGGRHWLYCSDCERWWFTNRQYCRRCESELERAAQEVMVDFMIEMHGFWQALIASTGAETLEQRRKCRYTENEVAGLLATKKRHEAQLGKLSQ